MAWSTFSVIAANHSGAAVYVRRTGDLVREMVRNRRAAGAKNEDAIRVVARELCLSERRVRAYLYGEVACVVADEYVTVRRRFQDHLDREAKRLVAEVAVLQARRDALDRIE